MKEIDCIFTDNPDPKIYEKAFPLLVDELLTKIYEIGESGQNEPYHRFADGMYARELFIAKNQLIVGQTHKTEHFNIISKGDISIATKEGTMRVKAPHTFVSKAGIQKVVYAHEDTVWTTVHVTNETDVAKIEADIAEPVMRILE